MILLLFLFLIIGCNIKDEKDFDPSKETDKEYSCDNTGHSGYTTIEHKGITREYILHVPSSYSSSTPSSLIIAFHGFGGCASDFATEVGDLNSVADNNNFIVAYPQAILGEKGDVYWTPGDTEIKNITENDVYFTEQLISEIQNNYNIDASHVYAVGYSNGGMMSYGLACSRPDLIAAIGIMSGVMLPQTCDGNEYTSIILFHGINDEVLPYNGDQNYQSVSDVVSFWLKHNNIPSSSLVTTALNDGSAVRDSYTGGDENTSVVLFTMHQENGKGGGHSWFSEHIDGSSPNQILWDFLATYSLDD